MNCFAEFEAVPVLNNMDDSRAALVKAYNAVRERYNKVRLQYRQLLKDRTCPKCRQRVNARVEANDSPGRLNASMVSQAAPSDARNICEINEICDQLKEMVEVGQVAGGCTIQSIIPHLENIARRMATDAAFDEQQESLHNASISELSSSFPTLSTSHLEASATVDCNSSDLPQNIPGKLDKYLRLLKQSYAQ